MDAAIIVGAGRGHRMGGPIPKQYRDLAGMPVIRRTLLAFLRHPEIGCVQAVIHEDDRDLYAEAADGLDLPPPVIGGATRQASVRRGLESLADAPPRKVLIHDAVRPFVTPATISAVIAALDISAAAIAGVPVTDTLKRCRDGVIEATVDRANIWRAQTPQGFWFDRILAAHRTLHERSPNEFDLTDDSLVAESDGAQVAITLGSEDNLKITTEHDLERAHAILARNYARETRPSSG